MTGQMMKMVNKGEEKVVVVKQEREVREILQGQSWYGNLWKLLKRI